VALRLTKKDFQKVETFIKEEFDRRSSNSFRKKHEMRWTEVDRMVAMIPMEKRSRDGELLETEWQSAVEIGELSISSEILSADIERLTFPEEWFSVTADLEEEIDPQSGQPLPDADQQVFVDETLRSIMVQQHADFGFKHRVALSVKEALHHGSYVTVVEEETLINTDHEGVVESIKAPVWTPHSMWNCYPEACNNPIYDKSMMIVSYMKFSEVQKQKDWINKNKVQKKTKKDDEDVKIITYWGDMPIKRNGKEQFIPNVKIKLANDVIVFAQSSKTKYKNIIYNGYERLDVRDPYFVSPLMKQAANQLIASVMINKFNDGVARAVEPPTDYLETDNYLTAQGGPSNAPGSMNQVANLDNVRERTVGDPSAALNGYQVMLDQIRQGLGTDPNRAGVSASVDQTAFEVNKTFQQAEIRTVNFVSRHERFGLKPFLVMQHEMNKKSLNNYPYKNTNPDSPDFELASKEDLPKDVLFEVTGSKGILGEEQRQQQSQQWTAFLLGNPLTAPKVNISNIAKQGYIDAGVKQPERFVNVSAEDDELEKNFQQQLQQVQQEAQGAIQQLQEQIQQKDQDLLKANVNIETNKIKSEEQRLKIEQRDQRVSQMQTDLNEMQALLQIERASERLTTRTN